MTKLLSLENRFEWSAYLTKLPEIRQDIYYTPEYYEIYEKHGDGKAFCFVYTEGDKTALYPFLLNRINDLGYELGGTYYDIQGAYGYNGVVYSSEDPDFIKNFYCEFNRFCRVNNIIAEFTRFNPLLINQKFSEGYLNISFNRKTIYIDLTKAYNEIYKNYHQSLKRALKTAKKSNLIIKFYEKGFSFRNEFTQIYTENMNRVAADPYLYFNNIYFQNIFKVRNLIQFVVFKDKAIIASALCFYNKNYYHYHLSASKTEYLSYRPNNFLLDEIIRFGIDKGLKILHLGGGSSTSGDNSLFRFKKNFSQTTMDFFIGKKIHDEKIYLKCDEQWLRKYPLLTNKYKDIFLRYRFVD